MSRKTNLNLDEDSLKVIDPNQEQIDDPNTMNEVSDSKQDLDEQAKNIAYELNNIERDQQDWIDENQISIEQNNNEWTTSELRTTKPLSSLFKEEVKVKKDPTRSVILSTLFVDLFFGIWLFILCMLPIFSSTLEIGNVTQIFYKETPSSIFTLTALGYVNLVFSAIVLSLNIAAIVLRKKNKYKDFYFNKLKKSANISFYTFFALYLAIMLVMMLNLFIPPFGINSNSSYYSLMYSFENSSIVKSIGWYFIIVLFSVLISLYFTTFIVLGMLQSNLLNIQKIKEKHQILKAFFEDLKKIQKEKKANKEKKRKIIAEEEELLSNLKEITEEEKQLISEEEFQERMKSNNEIRNKIKELQKQQEEIRKQQSIFLKNRKEDTINRRPLKPKKQEITIPDKELEEIFKNIELD